MAIQLFEIPLTRGPQLFGTTIRNRNLRLKLTYRPDPGPGWLLDIYDDAEVPILCGTPLVPATDLLAPYPFLNIGVRLFVLSDGQEDADLTYDAIGTSAHLYYAFDDGS
jgi:hypothetical protein